MNAIYVASLLRSQSESLKTRALRWWWQKEGYFTPKGYRGNPNWCRGIGVIYCLCFDLAAGTWRTTRLLAKRCLFEESRGACDASDMSPRK